MAENIFLEDKHSAFDYYWDITEVKVTDSEKEQLRDEAVERINELIVDGFTSGDLSAEIDTEQEGMFGFGGAWGVGVND